VKDCTEGEHGEAFARVIKEWGKILQGMSQSVTVEQKGFKRFNKPTLTKLTAEVNKRYDKKSGQVIINSDDDMGDEDEDEEEEEEVDEEEDESEEREEVEEGGKEEEENQVKSLKRKANTKGKQNTKKKVQRKASSIKVLSVPKRCGRRFIDRPAASLSIGAYSRSPRFPCITATYEKPDPGAPVIHSGVCVCVCVYVLSHVWTADKY
jgi:hypothetical protein